MAARKASMDLGEPTGRLAQLFAETVVPQPYHVTNKVVIQPPTKASMEAMTNAQTALLLYQALFNEAINRQPGDASMPTDEQLNELSKLINDSQRAWNEAFFADQYDNVLAIFADKPPALWEAFIADIRAQFLGPAPADGKCRTCGHVDEELAGKDATPSI
ncbi:MAG: hypothetical protein K2Q25_02430 [Mycobacteriaceae bacterium]|nr:hypothetical protein [Mycobacteriaceae bacterium]